MADFDGDMNATPISKLPASLPTRTPSSSPTMPTDVAAVPNYNDLLRDVSRQQQAQPQLSAAPPQSPPPSSLPPQRMQHQDPAYDVVDAYAPPMHSRGRYEDDYYYRGGGGGATVMPYMPTTQQPRDLPAAKTGILATALAVAKDKRLYVVAAIFFVLAFWAAPRLQTTVPRLSNPATGRMTATGVGILAALAGTGYVLVADRL